MRVWKWVVLGVWAALLFAAIGPASQLPEVESNSAIAWLPDDAESTEVMRAAEEIQSSDELPAVVVYQRDGGVTPADTAAVAEQVTYFATLETVRRDPVGPIPSPDGQALQVVVPIDPGKAGWDAVETTVTDMRDRLGAGPSGLQAHVTGPGGIAADQSEAFGGIDGRLLWTAVAVVVGILLLTYRSPLLWLLPVISALVAVTGAQAVVYFLARDAGLTVNAQSAAILAVLVLGAGTDYALLLVARYREELRRHADRHEAMAFAWRRSMPAIVASGATVIAGMLCLTAATMNSTSGMGPVSAVGIVVGLVVMLTLLPALLVIAGRWVFWPLRPHHGSPDHTATGIWARIGGFIARGPRRTWLATVVALLAGVLGLLQLDASGIPNAEAFYSKPDSIVGQEVLGRHYAAGSGQPLVVVAEAGRVDEVSAAVAETDGIAAVSDPQPADGKAFLQATLSDAPDSQAAKDTVDRVREAVHGIEGADAMVGGSTAILLDTLRASADDNRLILPLVLGVVLVILMLLLRAVVAPLILIATVVLSFGAALGLSSLIFRHVLGFEHADPSLPLFVFVFLVALGIDYNIFLMTRVHEEAKARGTWPAALVGLAATGGVITSAGLVLAGTFAVLATLPVVSFAQVGIAVALGVILDTFIVRAVLVTALTLDLGRWMWWPSRLFRAGASRPAPAHPAAQEAEPAVP